MPARKVREHFLLRKQEGVEETRAWKNGKLLMDKDRKRQGR